MNEKTKQELTVILEFLHSCCVKNGVSAAFDKEKGNLIFFDTETYLQTDRFTGVTVLLDDLVN